MTFDSLALEDHLDELSLLLSYLEVYIHHHPLNFKQTKILFNLIFFFLFFVFFFEKQKTVKRE